MVLESTMICVDDSDYMRNGDCVPTRMAAMQDAVNIVCQVKTRSNPENNVGLLTLASSEVLSTLTTDPSKIMSKVLACVPQGEVKLMSGLRVAHLALKHRQGKNHRMRIIIFIGSPVVNLDEDELIRLGKRLKKEKVNVDIVCFGDGDGSVLQKFVDTLNGRDGTASHLVVVPAGPNLTDALVGSPILVNEDGSGMPAAGGFDYGVDPNDDPELALALRVSMEEQRTRQEAEMRSANAGQSGEEQQMLSRALDLTRPGEGAVGGGAGAEVDLGQMTEDEQIAYALAMSMQDNTPAPVAAAAAAALHRLETAGDDCDIPGTLGRMAVMAGDDRS